MTDTPALPRPDRSTTYEIGLLGMIALGVIVLVGIGLYGASKRAQPFDPSAYLVVLTLIVGAIKERWLSRSVDRMGQKLADSAPPAADTAANDNPAGTEDDPVIVAGAPEGHTPVTTKSAKT